MKLIGIRKPRPTSIVGHQQRHFLFGKNCWSKLPTSSHRSPTLRKGEGEIQTQVKVEDHLRIEKGEFWGIEMEI